MAKQQPPTDLVGEALPENRRRLATARALVAVAINPRHEFSVEKIAELTNLQVATVQDMLLSDEWTEAIHSTLKIRTDGLLGKFLHRAEKILMDDKASNSTVLECGRVLTSVYKTLVANAPGQTGSNAMQDVMLALEALEKANQIKRPQVKVTNGSGGGAHPRSGATPGD